MRIVIATVLFMGTAVAVILGCYLPLLWLTGRARGWVLIPSAMSLSLHPTAAGRVYAAYGGLYIEREERVRLF